MGFLSNISGPIKDIISSMRNNSTDMTKTSVAQSARTTPSTITKSAQIPSNTQSTRNIAATRRQRRAIPQQNATNLLGRTMGNASWGSRKHVGMTAANQIGMRRFSKSRNKR